MWVARRSEKHGGDYIMSPNAPLEPLIDVHDNDAWDTSWNEEDRNDLIYLSDEEAEKILGIKLQYLCQEEINDKLWLGRQNNDFMRTYYLTSGGKLSMKFVEMLNNDGSLTPPVQVLAPDFDRCVSLAPEWVEERWGIVIENLEQIKI